MITESTMDFTITDIFGTGWVDGWVKTLWKMGNEPIDERNVGAYAHKEVKTGFLLNGGPFKEISSICHFGRCLCTPSTLN